MSGVRWPFCATIAFGPPIVRPASNDDCGFRLLAARIVGIFFSRETRDVICVHRGRFAAAAGQRREQHAVGGRDHGGCTVHVRTAPCRQQGGVFFLRQRLDSGPTRVLKPSHGLRAGSPFSGWPVGRSHRRPRGERRLDSALCFSPICTLAAQPTAHTLTLRRVGRTRILTRIVHQALSLFEALYRPDTNAALAVVGLYGAFSKHKDVIKLYFAFLCLSCLTVR